MGQTKPLGLLLGLAGNAALGWGLYHLIQIGSCGDVGQQSCPSDAWPYFVALPVGILVSVISIFLGGGALVFGGVFPFFGLLPLVGALALRPWRRAKVEKAERLVATGGRGVVTFVDAQNT